MDELSIINDMLGVVGETGVSNPDSLHPSVVLAKSLLKTVNYSIQSKGWFFNSETGVTLKPAADGRIVIPPNTLKFRIVGKNIVQRGSVLYDMDEHTDKFTGDIQADIVYLVDLTDLPPNALTYIRASARVEMFMTDDGEGNKMTRLESERATAYKQLNAEHITFRNQNYKQSPSGIAVLK